MDNADITIQEWEEKGIYDAMEKYYDEIWVYGRRDFYDPIREYRIPPQVASKMHFTGYIPRKIPTQEDIRAIRGELGLQNDEKLILVTIGGGGDGHPIVKTFLRAFHPSEGRLPEKTRVVIVTGPFISSRDYQEVFRIAQSLGFTTFKFHRFMESLIGAAQLVVSMGGYNTVCEIVSQAKPFLILPRTVPREEQLIRAQVLCSQGFCDYLHPDEVNPQNLRDRVLAMLKNGSSYRRKMESFPFTGLDVIRRRILECQRKCSR